MSEHKEAVREELDEHFGGGVINSLHNRRGDLYVKSEQDDAFAESVASEVDGAEYSMSRNAGPQSRGHYFDVLEPESDHEQELRDALDMDYVDTIEEIHEVSSDHPDEAVCTFAVWSDDRFWQCNEDLLPLRENGWFINTINSESCVNHLNVGGLVVYFSKFDE